MSQKLREEIEWVDPAEGVAAQLEMQMGAGAITSAAHSSDHIPLENRLTAPNVYLAVVSIQRLPAVAMVNHDGIAVAPVIPASIYDDSIVGSEYPAAGAATNINRFVDARDVRIAGNGRVRSRPTEGAVASWSI